MNNLELGYKLLKELNIKFYYQLEDRLEIRYYFDNQAIIAYGNTEEECVSNFYDLYQGLVNPA